MEKNKFTQILEFFGKPFAEWVIKKRVRENSYYYRCLLNKKVKRNTFLLESYHAVSMTGNPYAIFNELKKSNPKGKYYWATTDLNDPMISFLTEGKYNVNVVKYESKKYYKLLATCEYLINDTSFMPYFVKRDEQTYINTWHGTPLKTLGLDIKNATLTDHKNIQRNLLQTDILLMPNQFTADKLIKSHAVDGILKGQVYITGNPRVDNTFSDDKAIRKKYNLPQDKKIILYAPTWKKDIAETTDEDIEVLLDELNSIQGSVSDEYLVLLKAHYFIYNKFVDLGYENKIVPNWVDTNELLASVDRLITDYSSIFFDFLPLKRPIYFFIPDKRSYDKLRGFYLDLNTLPGVVSDQLDEIKSALAKDDSEYQTKFHKQIDYYITNFCKYDDGHASERASRVILSEDIKEIENKNYSSDKKIIIAYGGGFYNNGITNSLINLSKAIDYDKYELIVLESERMTSEKVNNLKRLDNHVKILFKFSYSFRTFTGTFNQNMYYRQGYNSKFYSKKRIKRDFNHELNRIIGKVKPDVGIDFGGYNRVFNALIAFSNIPKKSVYLHNTMLQEYEKKIGSKYKHRWNLKIIFSAYNLFDHIISVSESANNQNKIDLRPFGVDDTKMSYVNNLIDGQDILKKADSFKSINDGNFIKSSIDKKLRLPYEEKINSFDVQDVRSIIPPSKETINFVNVARLSPEKNHMNLIKAFAKVYQQNKNIRLFIVGDGPLSNALILMIQELDLEDVIHLYGFLENPIPIVSICDCFIFPSNYEGQGIALLEAMVVKKPVIGTNVTGVKTVLKNYPNSLVNNSVDGLIEGMNRYLSGELEINNFNFEEYNQEAVDSFYRIVCEETRRN